MGDHVRDFIRDLPGMIPDLIGLGLFLAGSTALIYGVSLARL